MTTFLAAVYGHEEFGYNGGTGHEKLARDAAAEAKNDPYAAIDALVYTTPSDLLNNVTIVITKINLDLMTRASDKTDSSTGCNLSPTGNYPTTGTSWDMWFWDATQADFVHQSNLCPF